MGTTEAKAGAFVCMAEVLTWAWAWVLGDAGDAGDAGRVGRKGGGAEMVVVGAPNLEQRRGVTT